MRKKFKILALSMVSGFSVLAFATSSIAWFASGIHVTFGRDASNVNVFGGSDASYYKRGSGTEQDPYVIGNKIHLYNLAWLQYIGYYNKRSTVATGSSVDLEQCYFVLDEDIDMGGLTIPPIGTNKYPFLGNFDGQGYTISNFTISNDDPAPNNSDFGVAKPSNRYQGEQPDIVGFFGVMGKLPNQTITEDYDPTIVGASNVVLENFKVVSKTSQVLIGLAGGYVNGDLSGVKVGDNAKIDVNGQVSTAKTNITSNLSDYGLVGYTTRLDNSGSSFSQQLSKMDANYDTSQPEGGGQGNEWGGSIDMHSLNNRLYNHLNSTDAAYSSIGYYGKYDGTYTKISVCRGDKASTYYKRDPNTQQVFYNLMGDGNHTKYENYTLPGTYIPLLENTDGTIPTKNTGYIVSDSEALNSANGTVRSASYQMRYIANSLVGTNASDANVYSGTGSAASVTFNSSNLEILTNKGTTYSSSNYYLIKDSHNQGHSVTNSALSGFTKSDATTPANLGFEKYDDSRTALDTVLSGASFIHGIHFMGTAISSNNTITVPTAKVNGATKTNYVLPKSCIDFTLKENGYINFFGGSYYSRTSVSYADSFFSLNVINRNAQDGITSIKQINNIYLNTNTAAGQPKYVYRYSDNSYSTGTAGTLLFNMNFLMNEPPAHNALYYFEIPVNEGEYALGTVSGKSGGGYLMYLDIGASGALKDHYDAHYIKTTRSGVEHPIGVDFNVKNSGNNGGGSFGYAIASGNRGTIVVEITNNTNTPDAVTVTQSSTIATYSYRKNNYSNDFSITGMSGSPPEGESEIIRVLTINLKTTGGNRYNIVITETITEITQNQQTVERIDNAVYSVNGETTTEYDTDAEIEALSGEITDIDIFRQLPVAATLTRSYGTAEFYTEYNITKCTDTVVDVTIALNSTRITVAITNGYTLKVNDATISNGQIITQ